MSGHPAKTCQAAGKPFRLLSARTLLALSLTTTGGDRKRETKPMTFKSPFDIQTLKSSALARLHNGEPETMPSRGQIQARVFLDLAQNGVAIYACPDHPLARRDMLAVQCEVVEAGWQATYELLPALADTYPLHVLIVCTVSLTGPAYTLHSGSGFYSTHQEG